MKINAKYIMSVLAMGFGFGFIEAEAAPTKEDLGEIIFKIHDIVPEKNADGNVVYCNIGATFFNRTKGDVTNLAVSLSWNDDVISEIIDIEDREEKEYKRSKSKEPKSRYSTSNFTSKNVSVDLKLPPIKMNQQITLKTKVDTDRCFILLNDMDIRVLNCGTLNVGSSKEACANVFQYISPKMGEYYTEFKEISWENKIQEEDNRVAKLQDDVDGLYNETINALESITAPLSAEELSKAEAAPAEASN